MGLRITETTTDREQPGESDEMKARTLKAVKAAITKTEVEVGSLKVELPKAKSRMMDIQVRRERVVYKAKTGDEKAQVKLAELNASLDEARREREDFETAIEQGEAKLGTLKDELVEAKKAAGKALIAAYAKTLQEEHGPAIDEAIAKVVTTIEKKAQQPLAKLRNELEALGFPEVNLERKVNQVLSGFLQFSFYRLFPRDFERPHAIYRSKSLRQMFKGSFEVWADKAIRERARDEVMAAPIRADFSDIRIIPQEEAEAQAAVRMQMKRDAEKLRREVVTV